MTEKLNIVTLFKNLYENLNGFNWTEYTDLIVFDVDISNFLITYKLDKLNKRIVICNDIIDYSTDKYHGIEKELKLYT